MKRMFGFLIILLIISVNLFGKEKEVFKFKMFGNDYGILGEGNVFLSTIEMKEKVYKEGSEDLVSKITWDAGYRTGIGMNLEVMPKDIYKGFGLNLETGIKWYFPGGEGSVLDEDWDYEGNKYSEGASEGYLLNGMSVKGSIRGGFPIVKNFLLDIGIGVWYSRFEITAKDGYIYQVNAGEDWEYRQRYNLYGISMMYIQEWFVLYPYIGLKLKVKDLNFDINILMSNLVFGNNIDNHYFKKMDKDDDDQRYIVYEDKVEKGIYFNLEIEMTYEVVKNVEMGFFADINLINGARGDTRTKAVGLAGYMVADKDVAGADIFMLSTGVFVKLKI